MGSHHRERGDTEVGGIRLPDPNTFRFRSGLCALCGELDRPGKVIHLELAGFHLDRRLAPAAFEDAVDLQRIALTDTPIIFTGSIDLQWLPGDGSPTPFAPGAVEGAGEPLAGAYPREHARWRREYASGIRAPASQCSVTANAAGVNAAGADLHE